MKNTFNKQEWQKFGQEGEFAWHKTNKWRQTPAFEDQTLKLFNFFGFREDQFKGKTIIDLGCGSKLRTKFFKESKIIGIEPLASRFTKEIEWSDLKDCFKLFSSPAEDYIPECSECADLVISINVLDHCYNFHKIIKNISKYSKPYGKIFLSFDKHNGSDAMHPLGLNEDICEKSFDSCGLKIQNLSRGFGGSIAENTYGHGEYSLNYSLTKL